MIIDTVIIMPPRRKEMKRLADICEDESRGAQQDGVTVTGDK